MLRASVETALLPIVLIGPVPCSSICPFGCYILEGSTWSQFLRCSLTLMTLKVLREQCQVYYRYPVLESDVFLFMRPDLWVHGNEITKVGFRLVLAGCDPGHLTEFVCL